jgi:multicomponent Na+:H+ antiporter subunit E
VKIRRWLVAGTMFGVLWVFVRGASLTVTSLLGNLLVGLAVGLSVAYVFRRFYKEEINIKQTVGAIPYIILYLLVFTKEIIVANVDVAYRVVAPRMPLEPQVILVPLRVETAVGVTTIANSITITPGTLALDHDPEENALYVHAIDGRNPEAIVKPIREWEDYALEIFAEEKSPSDPAPEIRVHPPGYDPPEPKTVIDHLDTVDRKESSEETESTTDGQPDEAEIATERDGTTAESDDGGEEDGR